MFETIVVAWPEDRAAADALASALSRAGSSAHAPDLTTQSLAQAVPDAAFVVFVITERAANDSDFARVVWHLTPMKQDATGRFIFALLDESVAGHDNVAPFTKRHYHVRGPDASGIVSHIAAHREAMAARADELRIAEEDAARDAEPEHFGPIGPVRIVLLAGLGLFGAGFWLDAFGDYFDLLPVVEDVLLRWRASVGAWLTDLLSWLPRFFGSEPPRWGYNYFAFSAVFWLGTAIVIVPDLFGVVRRAARDGMLGSFSDINWGNPWTVAQYALLWVPIALVITFASWPLFIVFLPNAIVALVLWRLARIHVIILFLFSPLLFFLLLLAINAATLALAPAH